MSMRRILAIYGHPDDEGQVTGTMAKFVANGDQVTLVCATRGEVGEISDPLLATPETLGYVRELELRAAMAQIGVNDVHLLPYRDSGMAGWPQNDDPRALHSQEPVAVVREIVGIMRRVRPHLVFTWDPEGGYGHPDHVAVHRHTLAAFQAASDASLHPEAGAAWTPARLYWGARGMKNRAAVTFEMERRGLLPEPVTTERRERLEKAMAEPDPVVSVVSDVAAHMEARRAATRMHRTQFGADGFAARVPADLAAQLYGQERFYQAFPAWEPDRPATSEFPGLRELE